MLSGSRRSRSAGRTGRISLLLAAGLLLAAVGAEAQTDFHDRLFAQATAGLTRAKEIEADLLAPRSFETGKEAYDRAEDLYNRHRPLDAIREQLQIAVDSFAEAVETSRAAQTEFATVLKARSDAASAQADRYSPKLWGDAEDLMLAAAATFEGGDAAPAMSKAGDAQGIYRSAELDAIEQGLLGPARELIARAEKMKVISSAPQTFQRARQLLDLAQAMVRQNRYDLKEARRLASDADYEAAHAIYLHEIISQLGESSRTFEDAILLSESAIRKIAAALNTPVMFDGGYDPAIEQIITTVKSRDSARAAIADSLAHLREENENLRRLVLSTAGSSARATSGRPDAQKQLSRTITQVAGIFTPREGTVVRDGDRLVLRVYGLDFSPAHNALSDGDYNLVSKIERAIRLFPNCRVTVEGHTEAGASESRNQKVSEQRAAAVAAQLRTFPPPPATISSEGWGSSRPIADNTTAEGRARNRRIDVVILPAWALPSGQQVQDSQTAGHAP